MRWIWLHRDDPRHLIGLKMARGGRKFLRVLLMLSKEGVPHLVKMSDHGHFKYIGRSAAYQKAENLGYHWDGKKWTSEFHTAVIPRKRKEDGALVALLPCFPGAQNWHEGYWDVLAFDGDEFFSVRYSTFMQESEPARLNDKLARALGRQGFKEIRQYPREARWMRKQRHSARETGVIMWTAHTG